MNHLNLNSARRILQTVASNNGVFTWYSIVKTVDQYEDVERLPPPFYILQELIQHGYLKLEPPEGGNQAKYWITETGLNTINKNL
ncbi:MAG: hypothetical protein HC815_34070 [Richelia sp. RM1_1_1]|nr:hypothetical protein [Richelia sp. RM1_1_1]